MDLNMDIWEHMIETVQLFLGGVITMIKENWLMWLIILGLVSYIEMQGEKIERYENYLRQNTERMKKMFEEVVKLKFPDDEEKDEEEI